MKRKLSICLLITAGLLAVFYAGVWLVPGAIRGVFSRSLYNYRYIVEEAVARGDYDEAVAVLEQAKKEIPREIYFERPEYMDDWIGRIRKDQGRTADSLAAFLNAQKGFFRNIRLRAYYPPPRLINEIIEGYFETNNIAGAFNEARIAMDFYPILQNDFLQAHSQRTSSSARILRDLAILQIKAKKPSPARENLQKCLDADPNLDECRYWLGRLAEAEDDPEAAVFEYEKEIDINPFADNAARRLMQLCRTLGRDASDAPKRMADKRPAPIAEFLPEEPSKPLVSFFGITAFTTRTFELAEPGAVLASIIASSTPFDGVHGWVEILLDNAHVQTLYIDGNMLEPKANQPHTYCIRLDPVAAGSHTLQLRNLSDGQDETNDRNSFIHAIRVYRMAR